MTTTAPAFALIGRSFPSEDYELLHKISLASRAERRKPTGSAERVSPRRWRGSGEPVTLPLRLPA